MVQKIVKKHRLQERTAVQDNLAYWLAEQDARGTRRYRRLFAETVLWKRHQTPESCSRCATPITLST
jgi:hypothetical protein